MGRGPAKKQATAHVAPSPHCLLHGEKLALYIAAPRMKTRGRCKQGCDLTKTEWTTK